MLEFEIRKFGKYFYIIHISFPATNLKLALSNVNSSDIGFEKHFRDLSILYPKVIANFCESDQYSDKIGGSYIIRCTRLLEEITGSIFESKFKKSDILFSNMPFMVVELVFKAFKFQGSWKKSSRKFDIYDFVSECYRFLESVVENDQTMSQYLWHYKSSFNSMKWTFNKTIDDRQSFGNRSEPRKKLYDQHENFIDIVANNLYTSILSLHSLHLLAVHKRMVLSEVGNYSRDLNSRHIQSFIKSKISEKEIGEEELSKNLFWFGQQELYSHTGKRELAKGVLGH